MHVSLDSALGRQRRLNSVGESVLQIAPSAAAAYSLRSLTGGDPKVVRVRRGSNNAESDFTASGVSSGALLDFVTTSQIGWNVQPTFSNDSGTGSVTSQSSTATTATVAFTGDADLIRQTSKPNHVLGSSGDQVIFNISISGLDSSGTLRLRTSGTNTTVGSSSISNGDNQDITLNLTGNAGYLAITVAASSGGTITFNSITVLPKSGFVETWYDQSGNSKDAVQATAGSQPKIVDAGSLNSGGIDFDGTDDFLNHSGNFLGSSAASSFSVSNFDSASASSREIIYGLQDSSGNRYDFLVTRQSNGKIDLYVEGNSESGSGLSIADTNQHLLTAIYVDTEKRDIFDDGVLGHSFSNFNQGALTDGTDFLIGQDILNSNRFNGSIAELIVYNTDQSSNRVAIETNINSHYSIF